MPDKNLLTVIWLVKTNKRILTSPVLLNKVMQKKGTPRRVDDDEEAQEKIKASVWYIELAKWFLQERVIVACYSLFVRRYTRWITPINYQRITRMPFVEVPTIKDIRDL